MTFYGYDGDNCAIIIRDTSPHIFPENPSENPFSWRAGECLMSKD